MTKHLAVRVLVTGALAAALFTALPAEAGQIDPDAAFTVTIAKAVEGSTDGGDFDFEMTCSSDDGVGEPSFVSIDDPTFPGFETSDSVEFTLAAGEEETFDVYVEFSRETIITCRSEETGATDEPTSTEVGCVADAYIECTDPTEGDQSEQGFGEATLSWVDIPDFPIESAGGATFTFTNTYAGVADTTTTSTTAATAATAATPRFTG
jgi:hypothetical protein